MALPFLLVLGCVVRYGDPVETVITEEIAAPVSFTELESRIDELLDGMDDLDRIERLSAARVLASQMKSQPPEAQQQVLEYLTLIVDLEERARPMEVESQPEAASLIEIAPIEEEALEVEELAEEPVEEPEPTEEPVEEPPEARDGGADAAPALSGTEAMLAEARALLDADDPHAAMVSLERCLGKSCWVEVAGLWAHARDLHVYQLREAAAERFLAARDEPDPEKKGSQLRAVEEELTQLLARYPNTRYAPALQRNLALVQGELNALIEP